MSEKAVSIIFIIIFIFFRVKTVTAQALYNLTKCAHRVYLDGNGNPAEKREVSGFVKLLWELGLQTEQEYIRSLGSIDFPDLQPLSPDEAFSETLRLMREGTPLIYQGCLKDNAFVGRPDVLLRREDLQTTFGPYGYEPLDIKAGKGWEESDNKKPRFKQHYAFQILFYRMLLTRIQGSIPPTARIINVNKEIEEFDPALFERDFDQALAHAQRLVSGEETSEPVLGSHCYLCEWFIRCERWVRERSDPTGLFFVGKQKFGLKAVGLETVQDIAQMNVTDYLTPPKKIPRMGEKALRRMKERARVALEGKPMLRSGYAFPQTTREIYFDIEDDPTQSLTYLFGLLIKDPQEPLRFNYFLARHPEEEERTVRAFWDFLASGGNETYYVYSHKERTTLRHLMERYKLEQAPFDHYVAHEYDLFSDLIVEYSDWPTFSYSLKHIAKLVGFHWRDPDPSGTNSIMWYNEYLENPSNEQILNRILLYNEDDCRAMLAIKDYFMQQNPLGA